MGNVTPPPGGLVGNSNYFIHSNGDPITDLIVSLQITEAIDSVIGVGFQLNCWGKGDDPTKWQQYILYFSKEAVSICGEMSRRRNRVSEVSHAARFNATPVEVTFAGTIS